MKTKLSRAIVVGVILAVVVGLVGSFALRIKSEKNIATNSLAMEDMDEGAFYGVGGNIAAETVTLQAAKLSGMPAADMGRGDDAFGIEPIVPPSPSPGSSASGETTVGEERLIIKSASVSMIVEQVSFALVQIENLALSKGGFVVNSGERNYNGRPSGDITFRVPVEKFEETLKDAQNIGEVKSKNVSGQDVTEEYVDLQAEIRNLQATENQLLEIMRRAVQVSDVLQVQRELTNVRGRIDIIQGRINYLQKSAKLSTITVSLATNPENLPVLDEETWKPIAVFKDALRSLKDFGVGIANFVIWVLVYLPVWVLVAVLVVYLKRKLKKKKK